MDRFPKPMPPRMSTLPGTPESTAAIEEHVRRLERMFDRPSRIRRAATEDSLCPRTDPGTNDGAAASAAAPVATGAAATTAAAPVAAGAAATTAAAAEPPQLHNYMPGSQAAATHGKTTAGDQPWSLPPVSQPVHAVGEATGAGSIAPSMASQPPPVGASWTPTPPQAAFCVPGPSSGFALSLAGKSHPSSLDMEAQAAASAAAAAVIDGMPTSQHTSLAAPFPMPPAPRRRPTGGRARGGGKRSPTKAASSAVTARPAKKRKTAAAKAAGGSHSNGSSGAESSAEKPAEEAAWKLVGGQVAKAVRKGNKELWTALRKSMAQIEHLRENTNRLEARVDGQGQCNERTAMAVASLRLVVQKGGGVAGSKEGRHGSSTNDDQKLSGKDGAGRGGSEGDGSSGRDVKPVVNVHDANAMAMALAPKNDMEAASLRRPIRAAVKSRVATANNSRDVLMDAEMTTAAIHEQVMIKFDVDAEAANNYLMNRIYFSCSTVGADPIKKRPMSVINSTVPHCVAQVREFIVKPFFNVLGFAYNPMPLSKAKKWSADDCFLTSEKGEKAVVAAAKCLFLKVGGGDRIVKRKTAGSRCYVDMVVGHHALIASFARNEFEIALGRRSRRRGGNDTGAYMHWVDEFAASVKHLSKNHKDNKVHAGYRITDEIDPDIVMRTSVGRWVFTAPVEASLPASVGKTPKVTSTTARPRKSTKTTTSASTNPPAPPHRDGAPSLGAGADHRPHANDVSDEAMHDGAKEGGVAADDDGSATDGISVARRTSGVVIDIDDNADYSAGAALIGIDEEDDGARSAKVGGSGASVREGMGDADGGDCESSDGEESVVGGRTSSSDSDDSNASTSSSDGESDNEEGSGTESSD